jgi:putative spermidine/putrescine transport system ATP-binding protein
MMPAAPSAQPILRLRDVTRSAVHPVAALRNLSMEIAAGEFLTVIGPAGAGKTTLLQVIAGFDRPDSGEVLLAERPILRTPPQRRGIGMVFPDQPVLPGMTAAANIATALRAGGMARGEVAGHVARALGLLGLTGQDDQRAMQLSPCDQARLALARAVAGAPSLILLDDPFAALDRATRFALQGELRALQRRLGVPMLFVTHDENEAMLLSDRIAVIAKGGLRQIGTPATVYDAPADAFVARFVGENNLLRGRIDDIEDDLARIRLECGPVVEARLADAMPGQSCMVAIRPERVAVAAVPAEEMGDGALPAELIETLFVGDHLRLRLLVGQPGLKQAEMLVKRPAGVPVTSLRPGQASVAWRPYDAWAFAPVPGL